MQGVWWYLVGDSPQGPVSIELLEAMLLEGEMTQHSLVWKEGLADWIQVAELADLSAVRAMSAAGAWPACASPAGAAARAAPGLAGAWRRFLARMLDLLLFYLPAKFLLAVTLGLLWPEVIHSPYAMPMLTFGFLALVLLIEAGVFACFGNSPGKALLGITVTTLDGKHPTAAQYLRRQLGVFHYGFAMGLPVISLMAMAAQGLNLRNGEPTAYDAGKFAVRVRS